MYRIWRVHCFFASALMWPACILASGLSDITGINIDIPAGRISVGPPDPSAIPRVVSNLPRDAQNFFLNPAGSGLAVLIRNAEAQAKGSSRPMPQKIRSILAPYFPARILDVARFTTVADSGVNVASGVMEVNQNVAAFTANEVIIFRGQTDTEDYSLWAHELVHATQYQNMGIEGFAAMYAGWGASAIEKDAYAWQDYVTKSVQASSVTGQSWSDTASPNAHDRWVTFAMTAMKLWPPQSCVSQHRVDALKVMVRNNCPLLVSVLSATGGGRMLPFNCNGEACLWDPNTEHLIAIRPQDAEFNPEIQFIYATRQKFPGIR